MGKPLSVLIVDDDADDAVLLLWNLKQAGYETTHERVETPEAMAAALEKAAWDVVISDHFMPRFGALEALKLLRERRPATPFLIVSGTMDPGAAEAALKAGAAACLLKDEPEGLPAALERALARARGPRP